MGKDGILAVMKIGIIGAMSVEVKDLVSALQQETSQLLYGLTFHTGLLAGVDVVIVQSGVGKVNAALCVQQLADRFQVDAIINTGIAGAIDTRLHVGDFVVSTDAVQHDVDATYFGYQPGQVPGMGKDGYLADGKLVEALQQSYREHGGAWGGQMLAGRIASGDQFISEKARKQAIRDTFHPLCVEMEGAAVAQACVVNRIPFAIVRCLSDTADETGSRQEYDFNETVMAGRSASLTRGAIAILGRN